MKTDPQGDDVATLAEIQEKLWSTPIPDKWVREKTKGGQKIPFLNWRVYVVHFDAIAPGWEMSVSEPSAGEAWHKKKDGSVVKMPTVSVTVHLTVRGSDGSRTLGAIATVEAEDAEWGLPADKAQWMAMKKAMRLHGLREPEAMRKNKAGQSDAGKQERAPQQRQERPASNPTPKAAPAADRAPGGDGASQHAEPAGNTDAGQLMTEMMKDLIANKGDPGTLADALGRWEKPLANLKGSAAESARNNWNRFDRIRQDLESQIA